MAYSIEIQLHDNSPNLQIQFTFNNMKRIGLLSDTHGYFDQNISEHFKQCDEIWHAGDLGDISVVRSLAALNGAVHRYVHGNIDGPEIRNVYPEQIVFTCEEIKILIRHIGGSPPGYNPATKKELLIHQPQLFITGHSHILKIVFDDKINCLYMNPGAAGQQGWHKIRTLLRFIIDGKNIRDCEVIELGKRG